jgi:hypothetical protein
VRAALLLVAATGLVGAYMLVRAVDLIRTGSLAGTLLGVGVLLLVVLGGLLVVGEVRLGAGSARLARLLAADGDPGEDPELPRTASGARGLARLVATGGGLRRGPRHLARPTGHAEGDRAGAVRAG